MEFSNTLLYWYLQNKRDLPWRNTKNPYPIWISEIMLQQTRVAQGLPYYLKFLEHFPTIIDLANANEEHVLKLWQGLGYYSRARNMHKTAQHIAFEFNGVFPTNYNDILKLKGIGQYTAAAIASFAFNEVVAVVDGNVFRVLSRYYDIETDISLVSAKKEFSLLASELIPHNNPALFNQAIMEFGALQCIPKNPDCSICIFNSSCLALQKKKVALLPVKSKKIKIQNRYLNYLIFLDIENKTLVNKRTEKGIWQNLYEFPVIESKIEEDFEFIEEKIQQQFNHFKIEAITIYNNKPINHKLSHQNLSINFYQVKVGNTITNSENLDEIKKLPFPIVIFNFLEKFLF